MGIDIGLVREDLKACPQARCRQHCKVLAGFVELNAETGRERRAYRLDGATIRRDAPDRRRARKTCQAGRASWLLIP